VLEAALDVLAEHGVGGISIAEIARRARVSKPTVYARWPGADPLLRAALASISSTEAPAGVPSDPRQALAVQLERIGARLTRGRDGRLLGALLAAADERPELLAEYRRRVIGPAAHALRSTLERARAQGSVREDADLDAAVQLLLGAFLARWAAGDPIPADWSARAVAVVWSGIAYGGSP